MMASPTDNPQSPGELPIDRLVILTADITQLSVDAIVNAANESLLGGGGVDGAIHKAAGPELLAFNRTLGGCKTGLAKSAPAFGLAENGVKHIIHTVGPIWNHGDDAPAKLGDTHEDNLLASCYTRSLDLAEQLGARTLAFPAISTGVYRFPKPRAARIAIGHILGWLARHTLPETVTLCCFSDQDAAVYREALASRDQWMYGRKRG